MKKVTLYFLAGIFVLLFSAELFAQNVTIDGVFRPRYEYRHGFQTIFPENAQAANYISQRSRLNLKFASDKFKVGFSIQNVGVWGETGTLRKSDVNGTMIYQAWGEILFTEKFSIKAGRQELIYDDQRIFGSVDWAQQGRSHDALLFKYKNEKAGKFDLGIAYNAMQESRVKLPYTIPNYKTLQFLHWDKKFNSVGVSFLFLNNGIAYRNHYDTTNTGVAKENVAYSQTIGARFTYKKNKFSGNAAIYSQMGNKANLNIPIDTLGNTMDTTMKISALYFALDVTFQAHEMFSVGLGFEYLSGNDEKEIADSENGKETEKAFSPFYGTNHKFNGWMDYFYVGNHFYSVGLMDIYIPLKFKKDKFSATLIPHIFSTAGTVYRAERDDEGMPVIDDDGVVMKEYDKGLGTELDLVLAYNVAKNVSVKAGYSMMFATETLEAIKLDYGVLPSSNNSWGWIMLVFKPTFYKSDKSN